MAAYAALASLMNNIEQMMKHPYLSTSFNNEQIQTLLQKSRFLLEFIDSNAYGGGSKELEDLETRITRAAYAAEDVIESHIVDRLHACRDVDESHIVDQIPNEEASSFLLLNVETRMRDMDALIEKANELKAKKAVKEEECIHSTSIVESGDIAMVGLDDELLRLLYELTGHQSNRHTISIVGMGGIGKTTLARNIYAHPLVIEHFDVRAWATLSQHYDVKDIFVQLLSSSSLGKPSDGGVGELSERIYKTLIGERYLVVLDDIWSVEAWDRVRRYLPDDGSSSSRVILTTRLSNVASVCDSSPLAMNLLDEDKSWKLFCEKANFPYKDGPPELEKVGKEMVRLCKGLALSIVVIGGLILKSPRTVGYWEDVSRSIGYIHNPTGKQESLDVLSLSYNHLPPHLKPCFLYMGVFTEDSMIRVSNITKLWVAEGFIRPDDTRVLEEIGEEYLNDLVDRNLILVHKRRYNGNIGSCGIHDLLRDLCIKISAQQDFFRVKGFMREERCDRRIVCHFNSTDMEFPLTRSIFTINDSLSITGVESRLLRVLSHVCCYHLISPMTFYGNVNLRYLDHEPPYEYPKPTWELPASLSLIWNLQTLIITTLSCYLVVAPSGIWKMRQLRHIKLLKIYLPMEGRDDDSVILENLQTLTTAVNLGLSEDVYKIIPNIKKLSLVYDHDMQGYDDNMIEHFCNVDRFHKLESLKMESRWDNMASKLAFPASLLKLSLSGFGVGDWEDLRVVGLLPQLQVLSLKGISMKKWPWVWSPAKGEFLHLKSLMIDWCSLSVWEISDNSHFPVLEKLFLRQMFTLAEIPSDIGEIPTLEVIRVDDCNQSVAISAVRIKEDHLETQDNDALRIQVCFRGYEMERFKEMVETEQLTLDNIQVEEL